MQRSITIQCLYSALLLIVAFTGLLTGKEPDSMYNRERISIGSHYSFHTITGPVANDWKPYSSGGLTILIPTTHPGFELLMRAEIGDFFSQSQSHESKKVIHFSLGLFNDSLFKIRQMTISPLAGVSNTSVDQGSWGDHHTLNLIASWENEFGIFAGAHFYVEIRRFFISVPITMHCIFSEPDYYFSFWPSVAGGIRF